MGSIEPHRRHCVLSLSKNINHSLVLVQPRKTRPFINERFLMRHKESNQTDADGIHFKTNTHPPLGLGVGSLNINLLIYVNLNSVHVTYILIHLLMEYNYL